MVMNYFLMTLFFFVSLIGMRIAQKKTPQLWWDLLATQLPGMSFLSVLFNVFSWDRTSDKYKNSNGYVDIISASMFIGGVIFYALNTRGVIVFSHSGMLLLFVLSGFVFSLLWVQEDKTIKLAYALEIAAFAAISVFVSTLLSNDMRWIYFLLSIVLLFFAGYSRVVFRVVAKLASHSFT
jgi:hypothetical protein